jgi:transposase-like protein
MAKNVTATKNNKKIRTTLNVNTVTVKTKTVKTPKTVLKQIESMYTEGMGPRRIGKILNMPRHHVMRMIEQLGLFIYAEGSYR